MVNHRPIFDSANLNLIGDYRPCFKVGYCPLPNLLLQYINRLLICDFCMGDDQISNQVQVIRF